MYLMYSSPPGSERPGGPTHREPAVSRTSQGQAGLRFDRFSCGSPDLAGADIKPILTFAAGRFFMLSTAFAIPDRLADLLFGA